MAFDAHANLAYSTVATPPAPASSGTSLVVAAGEGARFPAAPFNAIVWPAGTIPTPANAEIVRVTARVVDTLTITRTQEATSARAVLAGDQIAAAFTAKLLTDIEATTPASILTADGDLIIRAAGVPARLALSVPAANVLNVVGVANGETLPSYKSIFDGTNPAAIADMAAPGTSLVAAHRDHVHSGSGYLLLGGRAGGQTVYLDTASGAASGVISSTAHATKGHWYLNAAKTIDVDEANARFGIGIPPTVAFQVGGALTGPSVLINPTITSAVGGQYGLVVSPTFNGSGDNPFGAQIAPTLSPSASAANAWGLRVVPTFSPGAGTTLSYAQGQELSLVTGSAAGAISYGFVLHIDASFGSQKPTSMYGLLIDNMGSAGITTAAAAYLKKPTGAAGNHYFEFDVGDATALGAYWGRLPIYVDGVGAAFIPYYH